MFYDLWIFIKNSANPEIVQNVTLQDRPQERETIEWGRGCYYKIIHVVHRDKLATLLVCEPTKDPTKYQAKSK
jgi:hypothetical protein